MRHDQLDFEALGSTCHLLGVGLEPGRLAWGRAWVDRMHRRLTRFEPDSELSILNASAGDWTEVSPEMEGLLRTALLAYEISGGLVHAGVLASMHAIGYSRSLRQGPTGVVLLSDAGPLPPLPEVLEVEEGRARLAAGAGVDLGGLAKGWLADRLASDLGDNCVVNLGGDLYARGRGPDGDGWPVGVGGAGVLLRDQGAATSGTWRRAWTEDGRHVHHLIDPRTGRSADSDLSEVSVLARTATEAEVHAKAALLLGSELAPGYLRQHSLGWSLKP